MDMFCGRVVVGWPESFSNEKRLCWEEVGKMLAGSKELL